MSVSRKRTCSVLLHRTVVGRLALFERVFLVCLLFAGERVGEVRVRRQVLLLHNTRLVLHRPRGDEGQHDLEDGLEAEVVHVHVQHIVRGEEGEVVRDGVADPLRRLELQSVAVQLRADLVQVATVAHDLDAGEHAERLTRREHERSPHPLVPRNRGVRGARVHPIQEEQLRRVVGPVVHEVNTAVPHRPPHVVPRTEESHESRLPLHSLVLLLPPVHGLRELREAVVEAREQAADRGQLRKEGCRLLQVLARRPADGQRHDARKHQQDEEPEAELPDACALTHHAAEGLLQTFAHTTAELSYEGLLRLAFGLHRVGCGHRRRDVNEVQIL
eukprot:Rhum_TRINITY_DN11162_c1_g1::Rhum_TRINITY_DN11162_c1_g1_i1::g.42890::m.42890